MPFTDADEDDLKQIVKHPNNPLLAARRRQFGSKRKDAAAQTTTPEEPASAPARGRSILDPEMRPGVKEQGADAGEIGKKWDDTFSA